MPTFIDANFFLALMLISFGAAWPVSIYKTYKSRANHGKSVFFLYIILFGYFCGIMHQYLELPHGKYVLYLFILNSVMVAIDIALYHRNSWNG